MHEENRNKGKRKQASIVPLTEFEHPVEAVQAISMFHNQTYYDRKISVRMDRVTEKQESTATKLPPGLKSLGMGLGVNGTALTDVASKCECLFHPLLYIVSLVFGICQCSFLMFDEVIDCVCFIYVLVSKFDLLSH